MKIPLVLLVLTGIAAAGSTSPVEVVADHGCQSTCTTLHTARTDKLRVEIRRWGESEASGLHYEVAFSDGKHAWVDPEEFAAYDACGAGHCRERKVTASSISIVHDVAWMAFDVAYSSYCNECDPRGLTASATFTVVIGCSLAGAAPVCATAKPDRDDMSSTAKIKGRVVTFEYDDGSRDTVTFGS